MCIYVHMWVYIYMWKCKYTYDTCCVRPEINILYLLQLLSSLFFWDMVSYWTWKLAVQLDWPVSEPQESSCLFLLGTGIIGMNEHGLLFFFFFFNGFQEIKLRSSCLPHKYFPWLGTRYVPSPWIYILRVRREVWLHKENSRILTLGKPVFGHWLKMWHIPLIS